MTERIKVRAFGGERKVTHGAAQSIEAYNDGIVVHRGNVRRVLAGHRGEVHINGNVGKVRASGGNVSVHGNVEVAEATSSGTLYVFGEIGKAKVEGVAAIKATGVIEEKTVKGWKGPYTVLEEHSLTNHEDKDAELGFEDRLRVNSA